jgi:hypothetical protein
MSRSRISLARLMAIVAILAVDCALMVPGYFDLVLLTAVPILQIGLFRMVLPGGGFQAFWVGFEVFGWAGSLALYLGRQSLYRYILIGCSHALSLLPVTQRGSFHDVVLDLLAWLVACSSLLLAALMGGRLASLWASHRRANEGASELDFEGPHADAGLAARLSQ